MSKNKRKAISVILIIMLTGIMAVTPFTSFISSAQGNEPDDYIGEMLDEIREDFFSSMSQEAIGLEVLEIDMGTIIHVPQEYEQPQEYDETQEMQQPGESDITLFAERPMTYAGPFDIGDTRDFRAQTGSSTNTVVKGELRGQSGNVNIWVLDCTDYHAKTSTVHNANCHLNDVDYTLAQSIADDCDVIYQRMTADFGEHAYFLTNPNFSNCPYIGDLGNDGKVNFLLYDINGDGGASGGYTAGFFRNSDFWTDSGYNALDMMHIDIGEGQGYNGLKPGATQDEKFRVYGTLAHEFQHLLFYIYFGQYQGGDNSYIWFNEALAELAGTYYVQEGVEIAEYGRISYAVQNSYSNGTNFGDFLNFNNSFKNYGMGKLFSMLFYKIYGSDFVQNIYNQMRIMLPPAQSYSALLANQTTLTNSGHNAAVGNLIYNAAGIGDGSADSFILAYYLFMENFASDGGNIYGTDTVQSTKFYTAANPVDNLWAFRSVGGISGGSVFLLPNGMGGYYSINSSSYLIPAYTSGSTITLSGYGTSNARPASHEMLYKLSGGDTAAPLLKITAPNDGNPATRYYAAIQNDAINSVSGRLYSNGSSGADVYPLTKGVEEIIDTNGMPAYLFVVTLNQNVNTTVTYTWDAAPPPPPEGHVETFAQLQNALASYAAADDDMEIIVCADIAATAKIDIPSNPDGKTLTITSDDTTRVITRVFDDTNGNSALFNTSNGAKLVLEDIIIDGNKSEYPSNQASLIRINSGAQVKIKAGTVLRNNNADRGGAVYIDDGTLIMEDGEISGNTATGCGGGIYAGGSLYYGGLYLGGTAVIKNNKNSDGGNDNLYLAQGRYLTIGTGASGNGAAIPADGMEIWVKTETADGIIAVSEITAGDTVYFKADEQGKEIVYWDGQLIIIEQLTGFYGDVNGDNRVNGTDVQAMILWVNAGSPAGVINERAARISSMIGPPDTGDIMALIIWINNGGKAASGHPGPG